MLRRSILDPQLPPITYQLTPNTNQPKRERPLAREAKGRGNQMRFTEGFAEMKAKGGLCLVGSGGDATTPRFVNDAKPC